MKRGYFTQSFKAKVARPAIREPKTIANLAKMHQFHLIQNNLWKKLHLGRAEITLRAGRSKDVKAVPGEPEAAGCPARLFFEIS